jgi:glycosyltransferase involved in cell wall biosynthesis
LALLSTRVVAVNGRFLTMSATGVQRYAREILQRLGDHIDRPVLVVVPPDRILEIDDPDLSTLEPTGRWHGARGHAWEQLALPRLYRRINGAVLWSPCSWGPIAARRHVPVIHDLGPLIQPQFFTPAYRGIARLLTRPLVRRAALVVTPSTRVRSELVARFSLSHKRVLVIPPGVGPPFASIPLDDIDRRNGRYCLLVGAHDSRKNAEFLLDLWPDVYERTGLELHLTFKSFVTVRRLLHLEDGSRGVVVHVDPTDEELARLYAEALCVLWPSHYEGYGFPLLEAMATGTPFLATDVGAAAELAVAPEDQILPLEPQRWRERIEAWQAEGIAELRQESAARARARTWDAAARQTADLLHELAGST